MNFIDNFLGEYRDMILLASRILIPVIFIKAIVQFYFGGLQEFPSIFGNWAYSISVSLLIEYQIQKYDERQKKDVKN